MGISISMGNFEFDLINRLVNHSGLAKDGSEWTKWSYHSNRNKPLSPWLKLITNNFDSFWATKTQVPMIICWIHGWQEGGRGGGSGQLLGQDKPEDWMDRASQQWQAIGLKLTGYVGFLLLLSFFSRLKLVPSLAKGYEEWRAHNWSRGRLWIEGGESMCLYVCEGEWILILVAWHTWIRSSIVENICYVRRRRRRRKSSLCLV